MSRSIRIVRGSQLVNQIYKVGCLPGQFGCFLRIFRQSRALQERCRFTEKIFSAYDHSQFQPHHETARSA